MLKVNSADIEGNTYSWESPDTRFLETKACLDLLKTQPVRLPTGIEEVDTSLSGGFKPGIINEIFGEAGAGKTQFCLSLIVNTLFSKSFNIEDTYIFYFYTKGRFPIERLLKMLSSYIDEREMCQDTNGKNQLITKILNQILIREVKDQEELISMFYSNDAIQLVFETSTYETQKRQRVLLIVDSISGIFRCLPTDSLKSPKVRSTALRTRTNNLYYLSNLLKRLGALHPHAWILITNEASSDISPQALYRKSKLKPNKKALKSEEREEENQNSNKHQNEENQNSNKHQNEENAYKENIIPALGSVWSSCINCRFQVCKTPDERTTMRKFKIYSNATEVSKTVDFFIAESGIISANKNFDFLAN